MTRALVTSGPGSFLEQHPAGVVVGVVAVGGGDEGAGIDQEHSVAPETLGQQFVGLGGASCRA
jgi:hypothetical protein